MQKYDVVDVQVELKLLIDNEHLNIFIHHKVKAKIFNMVYWQCRASYSKAGFCTRDLVANMHMHISVHGGKCA